MGIFRRTGMRSLTIEGFIREEQLFRGPRLADDVPRRFEKKTRLADTAAAAERLVFRAKNPGQRFQPLTEQRGSAFELEALGLDPFSVFGLGADDQVNRARARMQKRADAGDPVAKQHIKTYGGPGLQQRQFAEAAAAIKAATPKRPLNPATTRTSSGKRPIAFDSVARSSPIEPAPVKDWRTMMREAADRLGPEVKFAEPRMTVNRQGSQAKGVKGESSVPPKMKQRVITDFIVTPEGVTKPVGSEGARQKNAGSRSTNASTKVAGLARELEPCVERPTGNSAGPGKWRGQWFPWC